MHTAVLIASALPLRAAFPLAVTRSGLRCALAGGARAPLLFTQRRPMSQSPVRAAFRGPMQERVEALITAALSPTHLEVVNESHGRMEDESHFKAVVVSSSFEAQSHVKRHRLVTKALEDPSNPGHLPFHSLTIIAKTPAQWAQDASVPASPMCAGGDGSGLKR